MQLRVNCVHAKPSNNPDAMKPNIPADKFDRKLEFKGYVSDLFTAPAAIKEFCCRMYNVHNTPVFGPGAEKYISDLTDKYKLRLFFVGQKRYSCIKSKYGGAVTVSSTYMRRPKNWFTTGVDKARVAQLNKETEAKKTELGELREQRRNLEAALVEATQQQDDLKKKVSGLKKKKEKLNIMGTRLRSREQELRRFLATGSDDLGRQMREIRVRRERLATEAVEKAGKLKAAIVAGNKSKRLIEVDKVKHETAINISEVLRSDLKDSEEGLKGFQREVEEKRAAYDNARAQMDAQKTQVRNAMGLGAGQQVGDRPPKALLDKFREHGVPDVVGLIEDRMEELNHQIRCLDDVDPEVIRQYQALVEQIEIVSREVEEFENKVGLDLEFNVLFIRASGNFPSLGMFCFFHS